VKKTTSTPAVNGVRTSDDSNMKSHEKNKRVG
jgi:hypothetical protein